MCNGKKACKSFTQYAHALRDGTCVQVKHILRLLESPFREWQPEDIKLDLGGLQWPADQPPPERLKGLCVSCSS